jgi:hypothetical protein
MWGLRPDFYYCQTFAGLFMWDALSDERTGLSFTTSAGPRQRSHSQVRVPSHSLPYFTVSDSRLPFSSPPTTRRVTVEVFDPASTRGSINMLKISFNNIVTCIARQRLSNHISWVTQATIKLRLLRFCDTQCNFN